MVPVLYDSLDWRKRAEVRDNYVIAQNYLCPYCKGDLRYKSLDTRSLNLKLFPTNFLKYPVHLHHDHDTGLTVGAYHNHCNGLLWQYEGK